MPHLDFFKRHYSEDTVLDRALKRAGKAKNEGVKTVVKMLYFNPDESNEGIADALKSTYGKEVAIGTIETFLRPEARMLIEQERSKNKEKAPLKDEPLSSEGSPGVTADS